MNDKLRLLCAELRLQLHAIDRTIEQIQTGPIALSHAAQAKAEARMDQVQHLIRKNRENVAVADAKVRAWVDHERGAANVQRPALPTAGQIQDLNARADDAESFALAVLDLADAAARECAHAILEAVLARSDADNACMPVDPPPGPGSETPTRFGATQ